MHRSLNYNLFLRYVFGHPPFPTYTILHQRLSSLSPTDAISQQKTLQKWGWCSLANRCPLAEWCVTELNNFYHNIYIWHFWLLWRNNLLYLSKYTDTNVNHFLNCVTYVWDDPRKLNELYVYIIFEHLVFNKISKCWNKIHCLLLFLYFFYFM